MLNNLFKGKTFFISKLSLVKKFALLSFLCLMVLALLLGSIISWRLEHQAISSAQTLIAQGAVASLTHTLKPEDFKAPKRGGQWQEFRESIRDLLDIPEVARLKIYNDQGTIIWSDERNLVGQRYPDNPELKEALQGKIEAHISTLKKTEHGFERGRFKRLMELYVPIRYGPRSEIVAVAEVYRNVDHLYADITSTKRLIWMATIGGLGLLFLILLGIVRRASTTIVRRTEELSFLLKTSKTIAASLDLDRILFDLVQEMVQYLKVTFCQIFILDELRSVLIRKALFPVRPLDAELKLGEAISLTEAPLLVQVLEQREAKLISLEETHQLNPREANIVLASLVKSVFICPMVSKERPVGLIAIGEARAWRRSPFSQEKVDLSLSMAEQASVAVENAQLFEEVEDSYHATLHALVTALDAREHETQNHSQRVANLTCYLARRMGMLEEDIPSIYQGALLHDIGKIGVSDNILLKPDRLTPDEWAEMKRHPQIGYDILKEVSFPAQAKEVVLAHHEWYNGDGYPLGTSGKAIPLGARIFAGVDALDAITHHRPYRRARPLEEAKLEIVNGSGTQFDPEVVKTFLSISDEEWIKLGSGGSPCLLPDTYRDGQADPPK